MKKYFWFFILIGLLPINPVFAGGTIVSAPIIGIFTLNTKQVWTSACTPTISPFDVFVATVGPASFHVKRFADSKCNYIIGINNQLPEIILKKDVLCFAGGYCGDQGTPDQTPFMALKVTLTNTSDIPNTVIALQLVQDPPIPETKKNGYSPYETIGPNQ